MRIVWIVALVSLASTIDSQAQLLPSFGRDRAGTSGFQFLKIPVDARSAGMGNTVASNAFDAASLFWNPALAAQIDRKTVLGGGYTAYHADVTLGYVGLIQELGSFKIGLSLQTMQSGEMNVTTEFQPFGTGETFQVVDFASGITVAQELTDLFSYGVTAKYVQESIANVDANSVLFDLGIFYRVGTTGAQMAVVIQNFGFDSSVDGTLERITVGGTDPIILTDFESFAPPTTFLLGLTYDLFRNNPDQSLNLSAQLNNPNDNAESFNVGMEYLLRGVLALRTGYRFGVEESNLPSFGLGLILPGLGPDVRFDYGYSSLDRLGSVHRIALDVQLR